MHVLGYVTPRPVHSPSLERAEILLVLSSYGKSNYL